MADTTAITITAIITTGVVSGVIGPAVTTRLEARRDRRRFRHERVLQDSAEVRRTIDRTADRFDAVVAGFAKTSRLGEIESLSLVEERGVQMLDGLEVEVTELEKALSRLIVRVGGDSPLAAVCREAVAVARDLEFELMGVSNDFDAPRLSDAPAPDVTVELSTVEPKLEELKALRPRFDAAAYQVAGAILE